MGRLLTWKWYEYGRDKKYGNWYIRNLVTKNKVRTSSEDACLKIIELAHALKTGQPKPLNQSQLERKAKDLEGIPVLEQRHWNWDGKKRDYNTNKYDPPKKIITARPKEPTHEPDKTEK